MPIKQVVFRIAVTILIVEAIIMQALNLLSMNLTSLEETLIDAISLMTLSTPIIYLWVIKPFVNMKNLALDKVSYLSHYDELTGLPNRANLLELLDYAIMTSEENKNVTVLLLGIKRLDMLNETFGHKTVEDIILIIAERLKEFTKNTALISKIENNKFVFLIENINSDEIIYTFAKNILNIVSKPINFQNNKFNLEAHVGISTYPKDTIDKNELIRYANVAMSQSKHNADKINFHTKELTDKVNKYFMLENNLRKAIKNNEFSLLYQPKIDAINNKLIGVEALIRWEHPEHGLINPDDFIPIAESTGLIVDIGEWVIQEAINQQKIWAEEGREPIIMSINLSSKQLRSDQIVNIIKTLSLCSTPMEYIEFEITETSIMDNQDQAKLLLEMLSNKGVSIAMDDFGTGYSSFAYLKEFDIDILKIDRILIKDIQNAKSDLTIIEAIIRMAHTLNIKVVAEGVETIEQVNLLKSIGCDYFQGFYYSKAVNPNSVYFGNKYII